MQKYSNIHKISPLMSVWLAHDTYGFEPEEKSISVTSLMRSARQTILGSRLVQGTENLTDISTLLASRMGTAIHEAIERAWLDNYRESLYALGYNNKLLNRYKLNPVEWDEGDIPIWLELRTSKQIDGWNISGCADAIMDGAVHDIKSTGIFAYMTGSMNNKYRLQLSIYAWLNQDKVTSPMGYIEYLFKDWSKLDSTFKQGYPQLPVLQQPIPLLSSQEVEHYIRNKLIELNTYWDAPQEEIPLCSPEDLWAGKAKWQYKATITAKKASKNFDTEAEARSWAASKGKGFVQYKPAKAKACTYCNVRDTCSQYHNLKQEGLAD